MRERKDPGKQPSTKAESKWRQNERRKGSPSGYIVLHSVICNEIRDHCPGLLRACLDLTRKVLRMPAKCRELDRQPTAHSLT